MDGLNHVANLRPLMLDFYLTETSPFMPRSLDGSSYAMIMNSFSHARAGLCQGILAKADAKSMGVDHFEAIKSSGELCARVFKEIR
jgi:hypothetical protein